jgi:CRISPR/Cas system-associated exonuclease Cas4 (RecB family)
MSVTVKHSFVRRKELRAIVDKLQADMIEIGNMLGVEYSDSHEEDVKRVVQKMVEHQRKTS